MCVSHMVVLTQQWHTDVPPFDESSLTSESFQPLPGGAEQNVGHGQDKLRTLELLVKWYIITSVEENAPFFRLITDHPESERIASDGCASASPGS
jgi:hypothetical protein